MIDILNRPQTVRLEPQTFEFSVLLQILDLPKALEVQVQIVVQLGALVALVVDGALLEDGLGHARAGARGVSC